MYMLCWMRLLGRGLARNSVVATRLGGWRASVQALKRLATFGRRYATTNGTEPSSEWPGRSAINQNEKMSAKKPLRGRVKAFPVSTKRRELQEHKPKRI